MRWNFAFLSSPGVFEKKVMPAFILHHAARPEVAAREREAYIQNAAACSTRRSRGLPGHFLHYLHMKKAPSRVLRSFCSYAAVEGWAHYAEQMMLEAGASTDPRHAIGQLSYALLREVRYLSAIGLHAGTMKLRESIDLFETQAFADQAMARQQATRGTFDPGYLAYTLGKLMIRKLRDDWKDKVGHGYSLKAFHDRFLSYGCAPCRSSGARCSGRTQGPPCRGRRHPIRRGRPSPSISGGSAPRAVGTGGGGFGAARRAGTGRAGSPPRRAGRARGTRPPGRHHRARSTGSKGTSVGARAGSMRSGGW